MRQVVVRIGIREHLAVVALSASLAAAGRRPNKIEGITVGDMPPSESYYDGKLMMPFAPRGRLPPGNKSLRRRNRRRRPSGHTSIR
jgi:hypothetical protein